MANRHMEFMEKIKFTLDKSEAKRDAEEFAKEMQDILSDTEFGLNAKSLQSLENALNEVLKGLGKQPIVITNLALDDNIYKNITKNIFNAVGIGIKDAFFNASKIEELTNKKVELEAKKERYSKRYDKIKDYPDTSSKLYREFKTIKLEEDVQAQAQRIKDEFDSAMEILYKTPKEGKKYAQALQSAFDKANNAIRFGKTAKSNGITFMNEEIADFFEDAKDRVASLIENPTYVRNLQSYINKLKKTVFQDIPNQIRDITKQIQEMSGDNATSDIINITKQRIAKLPPRSREKKEKDIRDALDYNPTPDQQISLLSIKKKYKESVEKGAGWEEQYQWLIKYVKAYEAYEKKDVKNAAEHKQRLEGFRPLYEKLVQQLPKAESMLRSLIDIEGDVGFGGDGQPGGTGVGGDVTAGDAGKLEEQLNIEKQKTSELKDQLNIEKQKTEELKTQLNTIKTQNDNETLPKKEVLPKLIHIGNFDGYDLADFANSDRMEMAPRQTENNYGMFGDGVFSIRIDNMEAIAELMVKYGRDRLEGRSKEGFKNQIHVIDPNDYNLYVNNTEEEGRSVAGALHAMQKLVFSQSGVEFTRKLPDKVNAEFVYEMLQDAIKGFTWSFEEFNNWITNQINEIKQHNWINEFDEEDEFVGKFDSNDKQFLNSHNISARFMKAQGYDGIYNKTGDTEIDGFTYGSVIYDPDFEKIKTGEAYEFLHDFLLSLGKTKDEVNAFIDQVNAELDDMYRTTFAALNPGANFTVPQFAKFGDASSEDLKAAQDENEKLIKENNMLKLENDHASEVYSKLYTAKEQAIEDSIQAERRAQDAEDALAKKEQENQDLKNKLAKQPNLKDMVDYAGKHGAPGQSVADAMGGTGDGSGAGDGTGVGANMQELKRILGEVTYNTKLVTDDSDKTANKITLDDSTLKQTLETVFANIINPKSDQKYLIRDPQGNIVKGYRGIHGAYGGLSSKRYNGASFFTDDLNLARTQYAGKNGKVEVANLSMKNPLELDAHGGSWAAIEYIGDNADEASQKLHILQTNIDRLQERITEMSSKELSPMLQKLLDSDINQVEELEKEKRKIFNDSSNPYGRYTTDQIAEYLPKWGYDGAIIKNLIDGGTTPSTVMISLDPSQIHYIETLSGFIDENTQQNDGNTKEPWALESTLKSVKGVLDNILAKTGTAEATIADNGVLSAIKTAVESINSKILKGTKVIKTGTQQAKSVDKNTTNNHSEIIPDQDLINNIKQVAEAYRKVSSEHPDLYNKYNDWRYSDDVLGRDNKKDHEVIEKLSALTEEELSKTPGLCEFIKQIQHFLWYFDRFYDQFNDDDIYKVAQRVREAQENSVKSQERYQKEKKSQSNIKNPKELGDIKATKVPKSVKDLQKLYADRGKLLAEGYYKPSEETQEEINQLNKLIQQKFKEVKLEDDKRKALKESLMLIQENAKQSEKALLIAKQADEAKKQAAKDEKTALRERMRLNKEESRVNASTSAWSSGNKILESLWKIDSKENPTELKDVQKLQVLLKELYAARNLVNKSIKEGKSLINDDGTETKELQNLKNLTMAVNQQSNAVKELIANYDELSSDNPNINETGYTVGSGNLEAQLQNIAKLYTNGAAKIGDFDAATGRLKYTVKTGVHEFQEYELAVREIGGAIVSVQGATKRTETFLEGFKRKLGEFTRYFSASSLIYKGINQIRKGIQYVREIDVALTELKKVTNETEEAYDKFLDTAAKTADKVGSTIKDVISSTADWARLNI